MASSDHSSDSTTSDLHPKAIAAWRNLMLAQAQQCFYLKVCHTPWRPHSLSGHGSCGHIVRAGAGFTPWAAAACGASIRRRHGSPIEASHSHRGLSPTAAPDWGAQACLDQVKPSVVAKLAAQVAASFEEAAASLRHKDMKPEIDKWPAILDAQGTTFRCWSQFHAAAEDEAAYEYGSQVPCACRQPRDAAFCSERTLLCVVYHLLPPRPTATH